MGEADSGFRFAKHRVHPQGLGGLSPHLVPGAGAALAATAGQAVGSAMGTVVQLELFRVTAAEPPWRDNRDAMEFPFLSLQKNRTKPLEYQAGDVHAR